jgi:hypothetical protein
VNNVYGSGDVVLIFARSDDPVTSRFAGYAAEHDLKIWQPANLEEIACSISLDGSSRSIEIYNRLDGSKNPIESLVGIWYQSMPPLTVLSDLKEPDRRYAQSEFNSLARFLCQEAPFPVVGQATSECPPGVFDLGLESRVRLRQLGLPTLVDRVGTFSFLNDSVRTSLSKWVRISRLDGSASFWSAELGRMDGSEFEPPLDPGELVAATITDSPCVRIALHVDADVLVIEIGDQSTPPIVIQGEDASECVEIARNVCALTSMRVGTTYLGHQEEGWGIARLSPQIPYWLVDHVAYWLFPRLLRIFQTASTKRGPSR